MTLARSFLLLTVLCVPAEAVRDDCAVGSLHDVLATAQEMLLLIAAFTIGWHLIGPFLGLVLRQSRSITFCASGSPRAGDLAQEAAASTDVVGAASGSAEEAQEPCREASFPAGRPDLAVDLWIAAADAIEGASPASPFPEPELYAAALEACVQSADFDSAHRLARRAAWKVPAGPKGASQVLALARWLARRQNINAAFQCIKKVRLTGTSVDLRTMKSLLVVCAQVGHMDLGCAIFAQLAADDVRPDFATYSAMIRGLCSAGKVEEALVYAQRMKDDAIHPDTMLFDVLLEACIQQNFFKGAEQLLAQMKELGMQPSNATLAACIRLYSSRGELNRAMLMFEEMSREYHLQPNAYVYGALIAACARNGKPDLALSTYEQMVSVGCSPSARIYEQLVLCCIQLGWTARAVEILDEALGLGSGPTARSNQRPRAFIDPKVVEDLLLLLARRKQVSTLGLPLLERLEAVDFDLPERVAALFTAAEDEQRAAPPSAAERGWRRRDFDQWRNFTLAA